MAKIEHKAEASLEGYHAAIMWFYENRPHMVEYIGAMGTPRNSELCDRAMVVASPTMSPVLYANDEFLQKIGPAEAAGVLAHEWQHILRGHHGERWNPKPEWKYPAVVTDAQEATINDQLEMAGYSLPEDVIRGDNRGGKFYGYWNTAEAYGPMEEWYLSQMKQKPDTEAGEDKDKTEQVSESEQTDGQSSDSKQDSQGSNSSNGSGDSDSSKDSNAGNDAGSDANSSTDTEGNSDSSDTASDSDASGSSETDSDSEASSREDIQGDSNEDGCVDHNYIEDGKGSIRPMTDDEAKEFSEAMNGVLKEIIEKVAMPDDEKPSEDALDSMDQDIAEAIDPSRKASFTKGAGMFADAAKEVLAGGKLQLGWLKILQKINPEVGKNDGGLNAKASYNWARPRRSTSLIPGVILPTAGDARGVGVGAKSKPTAMFPLDHSGSIDKRLANALRDMAQSIPEELIDARCYTFSTKIVPFYPKSESNKVASGGTDFTCIHLEALAIQKETGEYPYVVCLTDGEAWFESYGYGGYGYNSRPRGIEPSKEILDTRWIWVDVLTEKDKFAFHAKGYPQVLAQKNIMALPYDRSKL